MDPMLLALVLGLGSALTLAVANAAVKASGDVLMSRAAMSASAALIVAPFAFIFPPPNAATWGFLALSTPAHALYQFCLIKALSRGDLSIVFPLMRGSAPLLTAVAAFFFLGESFSPLAVAGLVAASLSTFIFALPEGGLAASQKLQRTTLFWALLTGAGIAGYNVIDAFGVRAAPTVATFIIWLFLLDSLGVNLAAIWTRRSGYFEGLRLRWRFGLIAGAMSVGGFGLALWGFRIAPVAYVSR